MRLTFTTKTIYGRPLYYPSNPAAQAIATINNSKTLNKANLALLQSAGFTVDIQPDPAALSLSQ